MSESNTLKNQFLKAEALVNEGRVQVPESLKYKLYGIGKQIVNGDCKMQQPPASNEILRAKWDAWTACAGVPVDSAMKEYIGLVEQLEPGVKAPMEKRASAKLSAAAAATDNTPGTVKRKGRLFKQRDFVKAWRARHFVLQDCYLHYYLDADEPLPRATLDLTGCNVVTNKSLIVDGVEYFPFTISHPRSKLVYNLSSDSKLDADIWVAKILEAATANTFTTATTIEQASSNKEDEAVRAAPGGYAVTKQTDHSQETRSYIPSEISPELERLAQKVLDALDPASSGWDPLMDKNGLIAKKKAVSGQIYIKAELELPFAVYDVFHILTDLTRQLELDPSRAVHDRVQDISMHSWVDYIQAKGIWPTSPRDFVNFVNWRLLSNGSVMIASFSHETYQGLRPVKEGIVRGEMIIAGFLLTPSGEGTKLQYLLQLDLKGSIPATVVSMAASSQALILANIKKVMENDRKKGVAMKPPSARSDYSELVSLMASHEEKVESAKPKDVVASGKVVPPHKKAIQVKLANRSMKIGKLSMVILLLPVILYFVVGTRLRAAAFLAGIMIAYHYLLRRHLGKPETKVSKHFSFQMPTGKLVMRFPVDLGRLSYYVNIKRSSSELEVTFTHVVVKACALVLLEMPSLNGHVIASSFFPSRSKGVDMSLSVDISEKETVAVKLEDVDAKPLELIADEILTAGRTLRAGGELANKPTAFFDRLDATLPSFVATLIKRLLYNMGSKFGMCVPKFGIIPYPLGVCTVINSPNIEKEEDMDMVIISDQGDAFTPITVTMSGMRILPNVDGEKKVSGAPVLNFSVAMSSYAASMTELRQFCVRLQDLLNQPGKIDGLHAKADFDRQEAAKRKMYFGKNST